MEMDVFDTGERMVHVRFEGRSWQIGFGVLGLPALPATPGSTGGSAGRPGGEASGEAEVRRALAAYFDVPESRFKAYVVEWHANGNITLRPEAVFG